MTPRTGAKEFAELVYPERKHQHMTQGIGQTATDSEYMSESRRLEKAIEQLKELISALEVRTEPVRVSQPTPVGVEKQLQPAIMSPLGTFLHEQGSKVRDLCRSIETLLSEMRI